MSRLLLQVVPEERRRHCHRDAGSRAAAISSTMGIASVLTLRKIALEVDSVNLAQAGQERVEILEVNLVAFLGLALEVLAEHVGVQEEDLRLGRECLHCSVQ